MLEYLDLTHLPFLDGKQPLYRYRRSLTMAYRDYTLDCVFVGLAKKGILRSQGSVPLALACKDTRNNLIKRSYFFCLLASNRKEYRWNHTIDNWVLLSECPALSDYLVRL